MIWSLRYKANGFLIFVSFFCEYVLVCAGIRIIANLMNLGFDENFFVHMDDFDFISLSSLCFGFLEKYSSNKFQNFPELMGPILLFGCRENVEKKGESIKFYLFGI